MQPDDLVLISDFCIYHHIEIGFVNDLERQGLIELIVVQDTPYIQPGQLARLEKFARLHQELAIHTDDMDVVVDLLDRIEDLQKQVTHLQNRLAFYER